MDNQPKPATNTFSKSLTDRIRKCNIETSEKACAGFRAQLMTVTSTEEKKRIGVLLDEELAKLQKLKGLTK